MSDASVYGLIGLTEESVGLDRRIYTGLTSTDPTLAVSYNSGRVDVFLNGVKLVGDHSEMPSGTKDYTFTATGQGSSITLATGVALVSSDVVEVMGYVSNSANTVTTYNYTATASQVAFTANNSSGDLVNVFLNGVLLDSSDYNLNTANTVTLGSGAAVNDIVHIQVIGALDNSNFVPAGGGTFSGDVTVPNLIIGDGGTIGSASDTDAISISSSGAVTFSQDINPNNFVGMIAPFAMATPPTGWLACDGSAVSKTTYSALFTALGANAWGTDTTDNFYLPDLEGAFLRGTGSHGTSTMADGNAFAGPSVGSFENDQMQGHAHTFNFFSSGGGNVSPFGGTRFTVQGTATTGDAVTSSNGTPRTGDETRPFNAGVKYCIKY